MGSIAYFSKFVNARFAQSKRTQRKNRNSPFEKNQYRNSFSFRKSENNMRNERFPNPTENWKENCDFQIQNQENSPSDGTFASALFSFFR